MDPRTFLERLGGGRGPQPTPELASALADFARLASDRPDLAAAAGNLAAMLRAAFLVPDRAEVADDDVEAMARGWPGGVVAFQARPPRLDGPALAARCRAIADVMAGANPAARALSAAIRARRVDLAAWSGEVFAGRADEVGRRAEDAGVAPNLAASVLRLGLLPALARVSAALGRVRPERAWDRGDCPHCGSRPILAESRGLEQRIFLRCGLCAADWPGERLRCPSCGETAARALHYSYVEGEQARYRLLRCDACRYHWKIVSTFATLSPPALIVADLATVHLDLLAVPDGPG